MKISHVRVGLACNKHLISLSVLGQILWKQITLPYFLWIDAHLPLQFHSAGGSSTFKKYHQFLRACFLISMSVDWFPGNKQTICNEAIASVQGCVHHIHSSLLTFAVLHRYIETQAESVIICLQVWIAMICLRPVIGSLAFQCYSAPRHLSDSCRLQRNFFFFVDFLVFFPEIRLPKTLFYAFNSNFHLYIPAQPYS
jgi:hypothetical protein